MQISLATKPLEQIDADAVVVGVYKDQPSGNAGAAASEPLRRLIDRLTEVKEITGKAGEVTTILAPSGVASPRLVVLGLGRREQLDAGGAFRATATAAKALAAKQCQRVAYDVSDGWSPQLVEAGLCGTLVGCVGQDLYRGERKLTPVREVVWAGAEAASVHAAWIQAEAINLVRKLVNEPASEIFPESFAAAAEAASAETEGLEVEIWDEKRLMDEGCGSLLAVARGSIRPPRLVILRYRGAAADRPWLAFVGKGVTFDSGGLSIKDNENMKTMKCDMAGAATVLGTMQAVARLKLPANVIGLCGLVENMISGNAFKLGDVLRSRNGKTIEVLNTDAEGRLVLADVLDVALHLGVAKIVDLATLTGACMVALGRDVAGAMTNDQAWCDEILSSARACGEPLWQLPMFAEYSEHIKSSVADIKNVGDGRWGGAITAAKFLEEFVGNKPWVHLDIAGPAFLDSPKPWTDAGGSGVYVRTLVDVARRWS